MKFPKGTHSKFLGDLEEALSDKPLTGEETRILTRNDYAIAIDTLHAKEKQALLDRFDRGAEKYGPCDLTARDWPRNAEEEFLDWKAYWIFERERIRRGL